MKKTWSPGGWRAKPALHIPNDYPDAEALGRVEAELATLPPLVFAGEARRLTSALGKVATSRSQDRSPAPKYPARRL